MGPNGKGGAGGNLTTGDPQFLTLVSVALTSGHLPTWRGVVRVEGRDEHTVDLGGGVQGRGEVPGEARRGHTGPNGKGRAGGGNLHGDHGDHYRKIVVMKTPPR